MMKKLKGGLTISRALGKQEGHVEISLVDDLSGAECVCIQIDLSAFAEALTGRGYTSCEFDFRPDLVGMRREHKEEIVITSSLPYTKEGLPRENLAAPLLAPFQVEGWKGRVDDLFNQHRRTKDGYRVTFERYVPVTE